MSITNGEKKAKKKFTNFLEEKGAVYSKFKELAPYFAIPYIENQNHFLLNEILKVIQLNCELHSNFTATLLKIKQFSFSSIGRVGTTFKNTMEKFFRKENVLYPWR
jgi:hypothetical protein